MRITKQYGKQVLTQVKAAYINSSRPHVHGWRHSEYGAILKLCEAVKALLRLYYGSIMALVKEERMVTRGERERGDEVSERGGDGWRSSTILNPTVLAPLLRQFC